MSTATDIRADMRAQAKPKRPGLAARIWENRLSYLFIAPFLITFLLFILIPVLVAIGLSFFSFNAISPPKFLGWDNFLAIMTQDRIFLQNAIPNTFKFAIIVGPGGYMLSFALAWLIHQLPRSIRDYFTLAIYAPSLASGVAFAVVWPVIFSGDRVGYLNNLLLKWGLLNQPVLWLQDPKYFMTIMIGISLWASMGVGFLAMLAGLQTVNREMYEAGAIDGISNRLQEIFYITIPAIKPQLLFGAVMSVVGTLKAGAIGAILAGSPITPQYSGHLIINHIDDFAIIRYELGYAAALSFLLLLLVYGATKLSFLLFGEKEEM
ncbi:carbohydrate ABC transporter permease [Paenibacillus thermotolerans]|uniref:carbohydrate ABC transporter permease n=1 Tax=Paenibacillus thermotolerans TaxID=3027807 RepID=UPI0023680363|nr:MULTISPECIES: sugar ABC transporter permease [unclassified Paenibacillus]